MDTQTQKKDNNSKKKQFKIKYKLNRLLLFQTYTVQHKMHEQMKGLIKYKKSNILQRTQNKESNMQKTDM